MAWRRRLGRGGCRARRAAARAQLQPGGAFNTQTAAGVVREIGHRHCRILQRGDGYGYWHQPFVAQLDKGSGNRERASRAALSLPGINAGVSREK